MRLSQTPFKGSIYFCQNAEYLSGNSEDTEIAMPRTLFSYLNQNCSKPLNRNLESAVCPSHNRHFRTEIYLGPSVLSSKYLENYLSDTNSRRSSKMCIPENNDMYHKNRRDFIPNEAMFNNWEEGVPGTSHNSDGFHKSVHPNISVGDFKYLIFKENQYKMRERRCPERNAYFPVIDTLICGKLIKESDKFPVRNDPTGIESNGRDPTICSTMSLGKPLFKSRSVFSLHSSKIDKCQFEEYTPRRNMHTKILSKANNITRNPKYFEIMDFNNEAKNKLKKSIARLKKKKKLLIPVMKEEIHNWKAQRAIEENREKTKAKMQIWDYNRLRMRKNSDSEVASLQNILAEKELEKQKNDKISSISDSIERDSEIGKSKPIKDPTSILKEKKEKLQFKILGVQPHLYKKTFRECIKEKETNKIKEKFDSIPLNFLARKEHLESSENELTERKIKSNLENLKHSGVSYTSYVAGYQGKEGFETEIHKECKGEPSLHSEMKVEVSEERPNEPAGEDKLHKEVQTQGSQSLESNDPKDIKFDAQTGSKRTKYTQDVTNPNVNKTTNGHNTEIDSKNEFKYIIGKLKNTSPINIHENEVFKKLKSEYSQQLKEKSITSEGLAEIFKNQELSHNLSFTNKRSEKQKSSKSNKSQQPMNLEATASIDLSLKSSKSSNANTPHEQKSSFRSELKDKCFTSDHSGNVRYKNVDSTAKNTPSNDLNCSKEKNIKDSTTFPPSKEFLSNIFYDWFPGLNVERHTLKDKYNTFSLRPDSFKEDKIEKKSVHSLRHNKIFHQNSVLKFAFTVFEKVSNFSEFTLAILRTFPASAARAITNILSNYRKTYNSKGNNQSPGPTPWGNFTFLKKQITKASNLSSSKAVGTMKNQYGHTRKNISYKSMNRKTSTQEELKNRNSRNSPSKENVLSKNYNIDQNKLAPLLNVIKNMYKEAEVEGRHKSFSLKSPREKSFISKNYFKTDMKNSDILKRRVPKSTDINYGKQVLQSENSLNSFYHKKCNKAFKTARNKGSKSAKAKEKDIVSKRSKELELFRNKPEVDTGIGQSSVSHKSALFPRTVQKIHLNGNAHPESSWQCERYPAYNPFLIYLRNKNDKCL